MTEIEIESEMLGGKNPIVEALRSGRELNKIWIAEGLNKKSIGEILSLAREAKVIVQSVPKQKLDSMLGCQPSRDYRVGCSL